MTHTGNYRTPSHHAGKGGMSPLRRVLSGGEGTGCPTRGDVTDGPAGSGSRVGAQLAATPRATPWWSSPGTRCKPENPRPPMPDGVEVSPPPTSQENPVKEDLFLNHLLYRWGSGIWVEFSFFLSLRRRMRTRGTGQERPPGRGPGPPGGGPTPSPYSRTTYFSGGPTPQYASFFLFPPPSGTRRRLQQHTRTVALAIDTWGDAWTCVISNSKMSQHCQ